MPAEWAAFTLVIYLLLAVAAINVGFDFWYQSVGGDLTAYGAMGRVDRPSRPAAVASPPVTPPGEVLVREISQRMTDEFDARDWLN